jgi:hypothetical protein
MGRPSRYSPEVRERVVRMVLEHQGETGLVLRRIPHTWPLPPIVVLFPQERLGVARRVVCVPGFSWLSRPSVSGIAGKGVRS